MKQWLVAFTLLWLVAGVQAEEHQRVRSSGVAAGRWETAFDGSLTPLGSAWWMADLNVATGVVIGAWSLQGGQGYSWTAEPLERRVVGEWGTANLSLGWATEGLGGHWSLRLGAQRNWFAPEPTADQRFTAQLGLQAVADPVILGLTLEAGAPWDANVIMVRTGLSFQEVLNDTTTSTLVVAPRVDWYQGLAFWSLSLSWSVGWYQGSQGASTGLSTGTGQGWTWSASVDQSWAFLP